MYQFTPRLTFVNILEKNSPQAMAWVTGNSHHSTLSGLVKFYATPYGGILVEAEVFGLPNLSEEASSPSHSVFYAMHIHEQGDCRGSFEGAGGHFNPKHLPHPLHAGDFMPLLGNQGYAWGCFYDKRFAIENILGLSVIIHAQRDDFLTQPGGDSGVRIGCGIIRPESQY
ncbi:MAG: superoxide dismutase family protein [Lachnospiraceae bacterium]|nr:superoxide dismutase family protein [Lachnospiraceae bacterium]